MKHLYKTVLILENWQHRIFIIYSQDGRAVQGAAFRSQSSLLGEGSNPSSDTRSWHFYFSFAFVYRYKFFCDILKVNQADVAEWLRRLTRNQFPSGSVGSNPTICAAFGIFSLHNCIFTLWRPKFMYFKGMFLTTTSMKLRRMYERWIVVCNSVCLISPWKIQLF